MGRRISSDSTYMQRAQVLNTNGANEYRPLTINVWHRASTLTPATLGTIFSSGLGAGNPALGLIIRNTGTLGFYTAGSGYSFETAALSTWVSADVWTMYTLTWDTAGSGAGVLYVNGVSRATGTTTITNHTATNCGLGTLDGSQFGSLGDYAEFAVWNSVLSGAQVASLHTGAEAGNAADTVGSPAFYAKILGSSSPEPETVGGGSWTLTGSPAASTTIASSPSHPATGASGPSAATLARYRKLCKLTK